MNGILWGAPLMILLVGFGLTSTIYLRFPQFTRLGYGFKETFGKALSKDKTEEGSMSSFQALSTAIAAQVGTGNIGGVAGAIVSGGPGAVFWMWITAILGMSTISVEAILAQKYREIRDGQYVGGPAFYISKGLKNRGLSSLGYFLAGAFSILIILALGFIGNMVQSNSISSALAEAFNLPELFVGIAIALTAAFIFIGGIKRIGSFAERVVPLMALIYIIGSIVVLVKFNNMIVPVFKAIFESAFSAKAVLGGAVGVSVKTAIRYGVARGLFSNEAGMGSTPNSHAVANVYHPVIQGCVAMIGVFIDTILVCTATSLVVLATDAHNSGKEGVMITMEAFRRAFGDTGAKFLAIALVFFAFTTIIGWYYFGESNTKYLFKSKSAIRVYQAIALCFMVLGSVQKVNFVWELTDLFNGLMVIPNIIGLFILLNEAKDMYRDFDLQVRSGEKLSYKYKHL
ncbi:alanine/glycine:cation symporter family protein [Peptoniphilus catoniae]|uniref:alanine/glycine:cation symporter family protein n=1 Tax=Peptoniphilus catoniae TaxID=1660341 RepID=UPI003D15F42A